MLQPMSPREFCCFAWAVDRIMRILGPPNAQAWPELEAHPHWRDNTENIRAWQRSARAPAPGLRDHVLALTCATVLVTL